MTRAYATPKRVVNSSAFGVGILLVWKFFGEFEWHVSAELMRETGTGDALESMLEHALKLGGVLRASLLAHAFLGCFEGEPSWIAMALDRRLKVEDAAKMRTDFYFGGFARAGLEVKIRSEGGGFDPATNARFLVGFPACCRGESSVAIDTAFWERPLAGPRADEQELDLAICNAVAHGSCVRGRERCC